MTNRTEMQCSNYQFTNYYRHSTSVKRFTTQNCTPRRSATTGMGTDRESSERSIPKGYTQSFPVLSMSQYETKTVWTRLRDKAYGAFVMLLGIGLITGILPLLACGLIMHACGMEWA